MKYILYLKNNYKKKTRNYFFINYKKDRKIRKYIFFEFHITFLSDFPANEKRALYKLQNK